MTQAPASDSGTRRSKRKDEAGAAAGAVFDADPASVQFDVEVYNGDIGYVGDVDPEAGEVTVAFDGRRVVLRIQRARRPCSRLCRDHPQKPGVRISRRYRPGPHAALPDAATQPSLHRRDARKAAGGLGWQKKAVAIAIRNASSRHRWSKLGE
jgi:exodeoxyribonuclease V alpha subunit